MTENIEVELAKEIEGWNLHSPEDYESEISQAKCLEIAAWTIKYLSEKHNFKQVKEVQMPENPYVVSGGYFVGYNQALKYIQSNGKLYVEEK